METSDRGHILLSMSCLTLRYLLDGEKATGKGKTLNIINNYNEILTKGKGYAKCSSCLRY